MPDLIFQHPTGAVAFIAGAVHGQMASIDLSASGGTNVGPGSNDLVGGSVDILISGVAVSQQVKVAYFSTLGDALYIYPLGNEMSKAVITGMALPASVCSSSSRDYSAAQRVIDFYNANKASNFSAVSNAVTLNIPPISLRGFIEGMTLEIGNSPAEFGFAKFTITMSIIPK